MNALAVLKMMVTQPKFFIESLIRYPSIAKRISDKHAIEILYFLRFGKKINLKDPKSFNEKLLWLTLYDRNPEYHKMVDKYEAKSFIAKRLSDGGGDLLGCIIPTLGIYNSFDEIDFASLPISFVMKTTHDSGGVIVVNDKSHLDIGNARLFMQEHLKKDYFWYSREWVYKDIRPRIIIEEKLLAKEGPLIDYKLCCFNGKAKYVYICQDRDTKETVDYFDMEWNHLPIRQRFDNNTKRPECPKRWMQMIETANILSKGIPFLRVDFYVDQKDDFYVGELTFVPSSGLCPITPYEWDLKLGDSIELCGQN